MTTFDPRRWLLVTLAIVGLALAVPAVSAHGNGPGPAADDTPPYDGTAADWAAWMESHMTDHMGPGAVEWMESHVGVTVDEMHRDGYADRRYGDGGGMYGQGGTYGGGMYGQGHC